MSTRTQEFRVGVITLMLGGVAAVLATLGTGVALPSTSSGNTIEIQVDRAPGVGANTPVRKDGVLIGRVVTTRFLDEGGVLVVAEIEPNAPIYQTDSCRIRPTSLFGDAVIDFSYAGAGAPVTPLEKGAMVRAAALPDPIEALTSLQVDVAPTIASIGRAAESVERLTERVNQALGEDFDGERINTLAEDLTVSMREARATMKLIYDTTSKFDALVSEPALQESVRMFPGLVSDARDTVATATSTLESFSGVVSSAEKNLVNLEGFTEPLGERGPELSQKLISAVENLDATMAEAAKLVGAVGDSRGTLNRLLTDPELYDEVLRAVNNVSAVMYHADERLKQMRPILDDIRAFSYKIAVEPGRLVGGALNRGPGVK